MGMALSALEQYGEALQAYEIAASMQPENQSYVQVVAATKAKLVTSSRHENPKTEQQFRDVQNHGSEDILPDSIFRSAQSKGPEDRVQEEADRLFHTFEKSRNANVHSDRRNNPASNPPPGYSSHRPPPGHPQANHDISGINNSNSHNNGNNFYNNNKTHKNNNNNTQSFQSSYSSSSQHQRPVLHSKQPYVRDSVELGGFFKASFLRDPWAHMLSPQQAAAFEQQQLQIEKERQQPQAPSHVSLPSKAPPQLSRPSHVPFLSPDILPAAQTASQSQEAGISLPPPKIFDLPPPKKEKRAAPVSLGHDEEALVHYSSDSDKDEEEFDEFGEKIKKKKKKKKHTSIFDLPAPKRS